MRVRACVCVKRERENRQTQRDRKIEAERFILRIWLLTLWGPTSPYPVKSGQQAGDPGKS